MHLKVKNGAGWPLWVGFQTCSYTAENLNFLGCLRSRCHQKFSQQHLLVKPSRTLWVTLPSLWLTFYLKNFIHFCVLHLLLFRSQGYQRNGGGEFETSQNPVGSPLSTKFPPYILPLV